MVGYGGWSGGSSTADPALPAQPARASLSSGAISDHTFARKLHLGGEFDGCAVVGWQCDNCNP